jgi:hypothetical protein
MNLQAYESFLNGLTKFTWIWNPNSDCSLEFKTWSNSSKFQVWTDSKCIEILIEFELKPIGKF